MRWKLVILLLCFVICHAEDTEDDFDGVTVEEEIDQPLENIYESPEPTETKTVYLYDHFDDKKSFEQNWVKSQAKKDGTDETIAKYDGEWRIEAANRDSLQGDLGLVLKSRAKHAAISRKLTKPFNFDTNRIKPLVVQYEVAFQDGQECGGAYIKLLTSELKDLKVFRDKTPYSIMFGPDKCGNDHKIHFIFRHVNPINGSITEKHLVRKPEERLEEFFSDKKPHLYQLILKPDGKFEIRVDSRNLVRGSLLEDFEPAVNPPEEIDDPDDKKPEDWDEREKIPDPDAKKPDDWDEDAPAQIPDETATKPTNWLDDESPTIPDKSASRPEDWDEEMDGNWEPPLIDNPKCLGAAGCGVWEPPLIPNPAYRGKWKPPLIENPNYRGIWKPRRIRNPEYYRDERPFSKLLAIHSVGFELWSMSGDILFDNVFVGDCEGQAEFIAQKTWRLKKAISDKDAQSTWGRVMVSLGGKPGWWAVYAVWCLLPLSLYLLHIRKRASEEESLVGRLISATDSKPWLWAVYLLAVALPVTLAVYCCCYTGSAQPQDRHKKTDGDGNHQDTDPVEEDNQEKTPLEEDNDEKADVDVEGEDKDGEGEEEKSSEGEEEDAEQIVEDAPTDGGDAPRRRRVRKE